jgi:hypothetical protein
VRIEQFAPWLPGPALAGALASTVLVGGGGPGFALFLLFAVPAFLLGVPLLQFFLLSQAELHGRHWLAASLAILVAVLFLAIPVVLGAFSFW